MQIETKEAMMLFEKKSKSMIRILRSNANNLEKSIIDVHTISSKYIEENKQETAAFDSMLRQYQCVAEIAEDIRRYCSSLRSVARQCGQVHLQNELTSSVQKSVRSHGIQAKMQGEIITLKMPHPINRYSRHAAGTMFAIEIREALTAIPHDLVTHKPVTLYFWHVYPDAVGGSTNVVYPDNDNYLVKSVIDQICEALGLRDDGTQMFLFHATILTDSVPSGTYVIIAPQDFEDVDFVRKSSAQNFISAINF